MDARITWSSEKKIRTKDRVQHLQHQIEYKLHGFASKMKLISQVAHALETKFDKDFVPDFMSMKNVMIHSLVDRDLLTSIGDSLERTLIDHSIFELAIRNVEQHVLIQDPIVNLVTRDVDLHALFKGVLSPCRQLFMEWIDDINVEDTYVSNHYFPGWTLDHVIVGTKPLRGYSVPALRLQDTVWSNHINDAGMEVNGHLYDLKGNMDSMFRVDQVTSIRYLYQTNVFVYLPITFYFNVKGDKIGMTIEIPMLSLRAMGSQHAMIPFYKSVVYNQYIRLPSICNTCKILLVPPLNAVLNTMHAAGFFAAFAYLYEVADQRATNVAQRLRVLEAWDIADEATAPKGEAFLREVSRRVVAAAEALSAATTHAEGCLPPLHRVHRAPPGLRPAQRVRVRGAYEAGPAYCALRGLEVANHVLEFDNGHFALPHLAFLLNLRHVYRATVDAIALSHTYGDEMAEVSFVTATVLENVY